ncbi:MAG: Mrp/NBP35 family ATP-binding protein [Pseudomonadota bacterium]
MAQIDEARVRAALGDVVVPGGAALTAGNRIMRLLVDGERVGFAIRVRPEDHAAMEPVRQAAEAAVKALGARDVLAALVADETAPAVKSGSLLARARRLAGAERPAPPPPAPAPAPAPKKPQTARTGPVPGVARIIAVAAGKGGVGKSSVSLNLAVALGRAGWRVGLLDADIYGPSVPKITGTEGFRPEKGAGLQPVVRFGVRAMSIGFLVAPEKAVVWRGPMVTGALNQLLRDTAWGELDCLVIDMPPGTGDIALSLAQQTPLDGAVIVTTPQDLALIDVRKAVQMFEAVNVPRLGVIENMSTFICPHCGGATPIFGEGGGEAEAASMGAPFLGRVPLTMDMRVAADAGAPVEGALGANFDGIAHGVMGVLSKGGTKPFPVIEWA